MLLARIELANMPMNLTGSLKGLASLPGTPGGR